ncbi:MAG: hypothetical protein HC912_02365 [Saprospiraceae bacterium]|nr:hypothetical protein [Saprospiraceae bacterium]
MRSFQDSKGQFWQVHQVSVPALCDKEVLNCYISYYHILSEYKGEPLETTIYAGSKFRKEEKLLRDELLFIKQGFFKELGFSK